MAMPSSHTTRPRLPSVVFYGIILAGVVFGAATAALAGWYYLEQGNANPVGRRIWSDVAKWLVIPICAMIGTTFGGLIGFFTAAILERSQQRKTGLDH